MRQGADVPGANDLADLVGPFWSEAKVCHALGVTPGTLASRREAGTVLGPTTSDGLTVYPVAQFHRHDDATVEVRPTLMTFMTTLRDFDPWTVAVLLHTPTPELDDRTPLDWVRIGGDPEALEDLARTVASEWDAGNTR